MEELKQILSKNSKVTISQSDIKNINTLRPYLHQYFTPEFTSFSIAVWILFKHKIKPLAHSDLNIDLLIKQYGGIDLYDDEGKLIPMPETQPKSNFKRISYIIILLLANVFLMFCVYTSFDELKNVLFDKPQPTDEGTPSTALVTTATSTDLIDKDIEDIFNTLKCHDSDYECGDKSKIKRIKEQFEDMKKDLMGFIDKTHKKTSEWYLNVSEELNNNSVIQLVNNFVIDKLVKKELAIHNILSNISEKVINEVVAISNIKIKSITSEALDEYQKFSKIIQDYNKAGLIEKADIFIRNFYTYTVDIDAAKTKVKLIIDRIFSDLDSIDELFGTFRTSSKKVKNKMKQAAHEYSHDVYVQLRSIYLLSALLFGVSTKLFYEFYKLYEERSQRKNSSSHHSSIASPSSSIQQSNNNESITYLSAEVDDVSDDNAPPVRSSAHRSSVRSTRRSGVPRLTHISGGNRNKSRKNKKNTKSNKSNKKGAASVKKNKSYKKK